MESAKQSLLCPYLLPCNSSGTEFEGYLPVLDEEFHIQLKLAAPGEIKGAQLRGNWRLNQLLSKYQKVLETRLLKCNTITAYVLELQALLEKELRTSPVDSKGMLHPPAFYETLLLQLQLCNWNYVVYVHPDLSEVHFRVSDDKERQHLLKLLLPKKFPDAPVSFIADLPIPFDPNWSKANMLADILSSFERKILDFQHFWDVMDEIDCQLWVLEPEKPTRKDSVRRIAIQGATSMQITVDPLAPDKVPECQFFGPDSSILPLQESMNKNMELWDSNKSIIENLTFTLQLEFPSPMHSKKVDFSVECGICYSYRVNDCFPDVTCDGANCGQLYHHACLYEWLRTLPNTRQSFNTLFGECPYCSAYMVCKIP